MTIRTFAAAIVVVACISSHSASAQSTSVTTDPVGFMTITAAGGAATSFATSFIGLAFTQPVEYQGVAASASGSTLTDNGAVWTNNQFNAPNGTYYVELTSASGAGRSANITGTSAANKSLTLSADLSGFIAPGTTYKVRRNWTLAALFGPNNESGLQGGTATTADQIVVYRPTTQTYTTYYYKTSGLGGTGWRTTASTSADVSTAAFNPTDGIMIRRQRSSSVGFAMAGAVKVGQTQIGISSGVNIAGNVYPTDTITLGNSGLLASGLNGGAADTADLVKIYNPNTATVSSYYYNGTGWRSTADSSTDASDTVIPAGTAVIIQRKTAAPFTWSVPQPF